VQKKCVVNFNITKYLDGFWAPRVSSLPSQISHQNANIPSFLQAMMAFFLIYLYDNRTFLLFYLNSSMMKRKVTKNFKNYKLKIKDECIIINSSSLANPINPSKNLSSNFKLSLMTLIQFLLHFLLILCELFNFNLILISRL